MKKIGFLLLAVFLTGVTVTQAQKKQYAIYAVAFYNLKTCSTRLISRIRTTKNLLLRGRTVGAD